MRVSSQHIIYLLLTTALSHPTDQNVTANVPNANHIFNAIHSSMRQWGESWYHNGMSFFLASVPAGTQLYHGTWMPDPVNGTEWLAFEPEHALIFSRPRAFIPPLDHDRHAQRMLPLAAAAAAADNEDGDGDGDDEDRFGYLHTYQTAKALRLLYIDGLSAGKTDMGTLDSQDRILFRDKIAGGEMGGEWERAQLACRIAHEEWDDRIDGLLRTESGFEIILCDFARHLDVVRISAVSAKRLPGWLDFGWYRGIAARFDGIGGGRVTLNYDDFVSAYAYPAIDLFDAGRNELPRLVNLSQEALAPIRRDLTRLVLEPGVPDEQQPGDNAADWQSVADMVVQRYANELMYLVSDEMVASSIDDLHSVIKALFTPFVDNRDRNATAEAQRCATQFIPAAARRDTLAARAVQDVAYTICATLRAVLDEEESSAAQSRIQALIEYLSWTSWKGCTEKCGYNEICFIPIWPYGSVEDRTNPQCRDRPNEAGDAYWYRDGPPRRRKRPDDHEEQRTEL
jgi:hypothetical protein